MYDRHDKERLYRKPSLQSSTSKDNDFSPQQSAATASPSPSFALLSTKTSLLPDINNRSGVHLPVNRPISTFETTTAIVYGHAPTRTNNPWRRDSDLPINRRSSFELTQIANGLGKKRDSFNPMNRTYIRHDALTKKTEPGPTIISRASSRTSSRASSRKSSRGRKLSKKSKKSTPLARPNTTRRKPVCDPPMIRLAPKPVFRDRPDRNRQDDKSEMSYYEHTQKGKPVFRDDHDKNSQDDKSKMPEMSYYEHTQKGKRSGRCPNQRSQGPPSISGWDVARPLGPHTLDHLPEYRELVPQIKDYVDKFALHMPKSEPSETEPDPNSDAPNYMAKHGIPDLFELMTTSLILKRPDDVLDYLINFTAMIGTHIRRTNSASASTHCPAPSTSSPTSSPTSSSRGQHSHSGQSSAGGQGQDAMSFLASPRSSASSYVRLG